MDERRCAVKVLQITTHLNIGGISNYILSLSKALKNSGVEVVLASSGGELEGEFRSLGISNNSVNIMTKSEFSPKVFISIPSIVSLIRRERIDVIHAHTRVSQVAAWLASFVTGVPFVSTCHGYFKNRARRILDTWGRKVIAISAAVKKHLIDDLGVKGSRVDLVYSGLDADKFSIKYSEEEVNAIKRSLGIGEKTVVGTIGRLSPVKGQIFFIEAMPEILKTRPDAAGLIVGSGPEESRLKSRVSALGLESSIKFIDSVTASGADAVTDTRKVLAVMDVFVFPSVREGLGIALLEALAAGRACVASRVGGIEDIITDHENGLLAGAGDVTGIAKSILELLSDDSLRARMADNGRRLVREKYTLERMARETVKVYKSVLTAKSDEGNKE